MRPVLSVTSFGLLDPEGAERGQVKVTITNTGMATTGVSVQCIVNKVVFEDKYTLELHHFVVMKEYQVPNVGSGESFTVDCNFIWSFWKNSGINTGFFLLGPGASGVSQIAIPVAFRGGIPYRIPGTPLPAVTIPDLYGFPHSRVTQVDGTFLVHYRWPLGYEQERPIHIVAERRSEELIWHAAPSSEAIVPDGSGWKLTVDGPPDGWGMVVEKGSTTVIPKSR